MGPIVIWWFSIWCPQAHPLEWDFRIAGTSRAALGPVIGPRVVTVAERGFGFFMRRAARRAHRWPERPPHAAGLAFDCHRLTGAVVGL